MSGLEVLKRIDQGEVILLVYRLDGRKPTAQQCEDVGEDHGFFEPKIEPAHSYGEYRNAQIVTEGFQGRLCEHRWGFTAHFGRNPFGTISKCEKCGIRVAETHRKRSPKVEFSYGEWRLREHVWRNWLKLGPVPGSLTVQEYHQ